VSTAKQNEELMTNIETNTATVKTSLPDDPKALAEIARNAHAAVCNAAHEVVREAITAGTALLKLKEKIRHGEWLHYLQRHCPLGEHTGRTARCYMQLAAHRELIEANWQHAANLSLRGALKLIGSKDPNKSEKSKAKTAAALSSLAWSNATADERRRFVDAVGLISWLAAMPPSWSAELERRIVGLRGATTKNVDQTLSKALRQVLSLQKSFERAGNPERLKDNTSASVAAALNAILNKLKATGFDLNDVEVVTRAQGVGRKRAA
jgi:hypothetical protein